MHNHDHSGHQHGSAGTRRLAAVLVLTLLYTVAEVVGGYISGSLALLADAGHMLTDNLALGIALFAAWSARRPPDPTRTYGFQRAEILAALANGIALVLISGYIAWEAYGRFQSPPEIRFGLMGTVAFGGLVVNIIGAWILHAGQNENLNIRAAYLHVLGDLLGSVGAIIAAVLIGFFGWTWADPLASVLIAGIIVFSSVRLILASVHVLMEGAPAHIPTGEVRACLESLDGVAGVHDLHLWSLSEGSAILTAHLVSDHSVRPGKLLRTATTVLEDRFGIRHSTLQVEPPDFNIVEAPGE
ncbi:MAG: cation transporter [Acidobacteria bacterium]|uniref:Cation transporter n=1 Tax=Candidatus Polarisedimenticola svalbardensis TaxID=2886004 RepID=A0A8J7C1J5_9BACT|nr:cation transporter [Candidatus Polarisedimenticola svalbardensis]